MAKVHREEHGNPYLANRPYFYCPGCKQALLALGDSEEDAMIGAIHVMGKHDFNGDHEAPTFSPSILTDKGRGVKCHSYVTDGSIRYLDDCQHPLKGQTIPLPEIVDDPYGELLRYTNRLAIQDHPELGERT